MRVILSIVKGVNKKKVDLKKKSVEKSDIDIGRFRIS